MIEGECEDQKKENRQYPNKPASVDDLRKLGIQYWKMDADAFDYPVKAVPWDPKDAPDPRLAVIRDDRESQPLCFWFLVLLLFTVNEGFFCTRAVLCFYSLEGCCMGSVATLRCIDLSDLPGHFF